jgi:predicted ATPase/DNA-binding winged helix-turn-helix (wHTH) protein
VNNQLLRFGDFVLLPSQRRLTSHGEPVAVGSRAFDLLLLLASHPGQVITNQQIVTEVWGKAFVDDANLRAQVSTLRRLLRDDQRHPKYISNVPGKGYCFIATVEGSLPFSGAQPSQSPPLRVAATAPTGRIYGRVAVIDAISGLLDRTRFVTITGPGGIGKSTVARAVASARSGQYRDGVVTVDLSQLVNPTLVPTALATALEFPKRSENPVADITQFLVDKQLLILLDSCEHVVESAAFAAEAVIAGTTGISILTTSREPLRAQGERVHRLAPLETPALTDGPVSAEDVVGVPAIELFVDRASACLGDFELTDDNASHVAAVCARLDGIALAIELAAGRLETIGIRGLAASLNDCFKVLTHGRRTALARHQTLRATLDWSYNLLDDAEQQTLRALSVFAGNFTAEGAREAASKDGTQEAAEDALVSLTAKSLVSATPTSGETLYRLLDTTRAYAAQRLAETGEQNSVYRRHAIYALSLFERAETELYSLAPDAWTEDYIVHVPTLRAALAWAFGSNGDGLLGARLAIAALPLFFRMSLIDECLGWVSRAITYLEENPGLDERNRMKLYAARGWPQMLSTSKLDNGMSAWAVALQIAESIGDIDHQLRAVWAAWVDRLNSAEPREALQFAMRFKQLALRSDDQTDAILGNRLHGATLHWLGRHAEAEGLLRLMLREYGDGVGSHAVRFQFDQRVTARIVLARSLWIQGYPQQALDEVRETIAYAIALDHNLSLTNVLAEAACPIALWSGEIDLARGYIALLAEHTKANSLDVWHTYASCFAGALALAEGQPGHAGALLEAGMASLKRSGFILFQSEFLSVKTRAYLQQGEVATALEYVDGAIDQCGRTGERWFLAELHRIKGECLLALAPLDEEGLAASEFRVSLQIAADDGALGWELRAATSLARLRVSQGNAAGARLTLLTIHDRFTEGFATADLSEARALLELI